MKKVFCQFLSFSFKIAIPAKGHSVQCLGLSVIRACQQSEVIQIYFLHLSKAINKNITLAPIEQKGLDLNGSNQDLG
jgi:hypothetical protein